MTYNYTRLKDCVVTNKNVIVRVDINVPIVKGKIEDDTRIKAVIPTLKYLAQNGAKVIVISHFGRPKGQVVAEMSLGQLVKRIQELLGDIKVHFVDDSIGDHVKEAVSKTNYGEVILLENLRFYKEETNNDPEFARQLAELGNLYVNDAFSCSHRAHSSIVGIPSILKGCAGFLLENEIDNLQKLVMTPEKPMMAIVGGSKVSTKIDLLNSLITKADKIFIAGGMANTFLYALGNNVGNSLCEKELKDVAMDIISKAKENNCKIILPKDVSVCTKLENNAKAQIIDVVEVGNKDIIADIGTKSVNELKAELAKCKTVVWNGPLGAFELKPFNEGTEAVAKQIAQLTKNGEIISVAGGGDVVSALNDCNLAESFSYISTAGGAFLEWLEGKGLPGVDILCNDIKQRQQN
ncbi:MAG: phosphoglycerate kinase [Proteobacteria bacterium]|nr:phosphoglycerate kinase [Pseudomonadota bacterium]